MPTTVCATGSAAVQVWHWQRQRGLSLLELMVGLVIGLLVVGAAIGGLMASRGISGTVTDASSIQQQASYAMRVIGQQVRQAGSLYLEANPDPKYQDTGDEVYLMMPDADAFSHDNNSFTVGFSADAGGHSRDCLGNKSSGTVNEFISSTFSFDSSQHVLHCKGSDGGTKQPIIGNVADFQVRYLAQTQPSSGEPRVRYVKDLATLKPGEQVQALEVCLTLFGHEPIDMPSDSTYSTCDYDNSTGKAKQQKMTTLSGKRQRRMHLSFRNVFQLRSRN